MRVIVVPYSSHRCGAGKGYSITGHHELTLPLLAAELVCGANVIGTGVPSYDCRTIPEPG